MMLLSKPELNHKIKKNIKMGYLTYSLNLAHSNLSGINVCPMAVKLIGKNPDRDLGTDQNPLSNCSNCCVGFNGNAAIFSSVMESRIKKTIAFFKDRKFFLNSLAYEIEKAIKIANKKGLIPSFRLNAYSDIRWENYIIKDNKNVFELFPEAVFYDYSKLINRVTPDNYQITYSHYGNWNNTAAALNQGLNVSIVFEALPKQLTINNISYAVVDGDVSDVRIDERINNRPVIVGLKFKGSKAKLNQAIADSFALPKATNERAYIC